MGEARFLCQREISFCYKPANETIYTGKLSALCPSMFQQRYSRRAARSGVCDAIQLFERHFLSERLAPRPVFRPWDLPSSSAVIPSSWARDPGGAMDLFKRFGKPRARQTLSVNRTTPHTQARTDTQGRLPTCCMRAMLQWFIKCTFPPKSPFSSCWPLVQVPLPHL